MGVPEPVFVGFWQNFVFKHFPTICPRLWIGKATSCSKKLEVLIKVTYILEKMKQKCGRMLQIIRSENDVKTVCQELS